MKQSEVVACPACGSEDVNQVASPIVSDTPINHGWYGQCHTTRFELRCDKCNQEFRIEFAAYKNRAAFTCDVRYE